MIPLQSAPVQDAWIGAVRLLADFVILPAQRECLAANIRSEP